MFWSIEQAIPVECFSLETEVGCSVLSSNPSGIREIDEICRRIKSVHHRLKASAFKFQIEGKSVDYRRIMPLNANKR